eukprot:TRINITY_DN2367_c0_g1_i3.p1 TRINITY_DN2367_c0_g1~~TRINITY_DN2367_c0_g1_i3.p1  ORF type:complete len:883 (-),score=219.48 TRINITY_DN2367_c0_g1_i3:465-2828(-)
MREARRTIRVDRAKILAAKEEPEEGEQIDDLQDDGDDDDVDEDDHLSDQEDGDAFGEQSLRLSRSGALKGRSMGIAQDDDDDDDDNDEDEDDEQEKNENTFARRSAGASSNDGGFSTQGDHQSNTSSSKHQPLSLEELYLKRKEEVMAIRKPVFMTKEERAKAALEKRQQEAEERRKRQEEERRHREATQSRGNREVERRDREVERVEREKEKELKQIKSQYLGLEKRKKRIIKPSEKFKITFDWNADDDTSKDLNPLYAKQHDTSLLFGKGMKAGIDRREQRKQGIFYEKLVADRLRFQDSEEQELIGRARQYNIDQDEAAMKKETHWSSKTLDGMNERDWRIFKEDFGISCRGGNIPHPLRSWSEAELPKEIFGAIEKAGYTKPFPIQMQCIPIGVQKRDLIGIAETGSGKTAAFLIPMLYHILKKPRLTPETIVDGPYGLVLAPTRELAQQIHEEAEKFCRPLGIKSFAVVGGIHIDEQAFLMREGCEIMIATPGRLNDCLERRYIVLNQCTYVVLDEADRMMDMGFEPQVVSVLDAIPSSSLKPDEDASENPALLALVPGIEYRTTVMFSATMPTTVERLAKKYLRRPVMVTIGEAGKASTNVEQRVEMMKDNDRRTRLEQLLEQGLEPPIIIFVNSRKQCDALFKILDKLGILATTLHGGKNQEVRAVSLDQFKAGKYDVLIATDVAGRGIDVTGVKYVINYELPKNIEFYTHRIGRTGRAGQKGVAISFLTGNDTEIMYDLKQMLIASGNYVPPELSRHEAAQHKPGSIVKKRKEIVYSNR